MIIQEDNNIENQNCDLQSNENTHYSPRYINKLVEEAIAIEEEDAKEADKLGYMARTLVQTAMPHSDPKSNEFVRTNGHYTLTMMAPSAIGLPYGSIPRIIIAWISTEAIKTKQREIYLGENLSRFLHKIGFKAQGGKRGDISRVKEQMGKLLQTHITCTYMDNSIKRIKNIQAVSEAQSWWVTQNCEATWQTDLILNYDFFNEIINSPIPIDLRAIHALKNSSLAIDIYCWLTYRMFTLRRNTFIPWDKLFLQFGSGYANTPSGRYAFKKKFIEQLKKVELLYNKLKLSVENDGLTLSRSLPHIMTK